MASRQHDRRLMGVFYVRVGMNYIELLEAKRHTLGSFGFDPVWMPDRAFDFQRPS